MFITNDIKYIGVNDREIDLFEGQYVVENGMAYNSYIIEDEKIAVFDTVDARFGNEWLANIKAVLGERKPDYLIIQHMEPDHSANINLFAENYPEAKIVASKKAFGMMLQFYGNDYADRQIVVGEGDTLSLGSHELTFVTAPMVHWPETMVTWLAEEGTLFSGDAFGTFGSIDEDVIDSEDTFEQYRDEMMRYYGCHLEAINTVRSIRILQEVF